MTELCYKEDGLHGSLRIWCVDISTTKMTVETEETKTEQQKPLTIEDQTWELSCGLKEGTLDQRAPESPEESENEQGGGVQALGWDTGNKANTTRCDVIIPVLRR